MQRSQVLPLPKCNPLVELGKTVLSQLIYSGCDTPNGVTILADQPLGNKLMLNVHRPAVLRQYYGSDIVNDGCRLRATLGFYKGSQVEGSDRLKFTVKPFSNEIHNMADYLKSLLNDNSKYYGLDDVSLHHDFNSCALLMYHSLDNIKSKSSIGWHYDTKHENDGIFRTGNTIICNTPIVIVTIGEKRSLSWRTRFLQRNKDSQVRWVVGKQMKDMELDEYSIYVINPFDEKPHKCNSSQNIVQYQHGNVSYKNKK
jgi:hypothetical protein